MHLPQKQQSRIIFVAAAAVLVASAVVVSAKSTAKVPNSLKVGQTAAKIAGDVAASTNSETKAESATANSDKSGSDKAKPAAKVQTYKVASGDTVEAIANKFQLKAATVLWANDMSEDTVLHVDQELKIPSADGMVKEIGEGDTLWGLAHDYQGDFDALVKANPDINPDAPLKLGQLVLIPGGRPMERRQVAVSRGDSGESSTRSSSGGGQLDRWPLSGPLTDTFGWRIHPVYGTRNFHDGIDIGVPVGTPVAATASGTVTMAGWYGGYGIVAKLDNGKGVSTLYAHLSRTAVEVGQKVSSGSLVGYSGNTGASTGAHLHFSVYLNGTPSDPMGWLP